MDERDVASSPLDGGERSRHLKRVRQLSMKGKNGQLAPHKIIAGNTLHKLKVRRGCASSQSENKNKVFQHNYFIGLFDPPQI
jgi:hypothetical protein